MRTVELRPAINMQAFSAVIHAQHAWPDISSFRQCAERIGLGTKHVTGVNFRGKGANTMNNVRIGARNGKLAP